MCGVYGFISNDYTSDKKEKLQKIGNAIRHRGPDQTGEFINEFIAMGINRLSVIDIEKGNQPIFSNNKSLVIIHNGEIYNYKILRKNLETKGYIFKTNTDTEVIVNLFQEEGANCLKHLNGMFSFAIYNIVNNELFIARDRFGIKPLYYTFQNDNFIFSSELKGIQSFPKVDLDISFDAIDLFLTMESIPTPFTIYKNIFKLERGHYLYLKNRNLENKKWYSLTYYPKFSFDNEADYVDELDGLIKNSVRSRLVSDVPIGAFLSGGLDSSLVASYMQNECSNLNTFSIGFEDASFDESYFSKLVADHLGTNHHLEIFSANSMLEILPSIWESMDEPFADASLLPTYLLSGFTKNEVTVSLSGDGGDEIFGGYPTYFAHKIAKWIPSWSASSMQYFANLLPVNYDNISFDFKVKQFCKGLSYNGDTRHQYWLGSFDKIQKEKLYNFTFTNELTNMNNLSLIIESQNSEFNSNVNWEKFMRQDMEFYLQDNMLVKVDRASMAHSLEVRVPYLDHHVAEFMARVPINLKYRGINSKYLLKKVGSKYLPDEIINRSKKGFGIPVAKWICGPLRDVFIELFSRPNSFIKTYFNEQFVNRLLDDHLNYKSDNRKLLWTLFTLENWYGKHLNSKI